MTHDEIISRLNDLIDENNRQMQKLNSRMSLSDLEKHLDDVSRRHEEMLSICRDRRHDRMSSISQSLNDCDNQVPNKKIGKLDYSHYEEGNDL